MDHADPAQAVDPAAARCPVPHVGSATAPIGATAATSGRPVPHTTSPAPGEAATGCPVISAPHGVRRSPADLVVRKLLRIKDRPTGVSAASAYSTFQRSMLVSATRCTLTYVIFPFVFPAIGFAAGVGPIIGVVIGTLALVCDTFAIRRFFAIDHKWRWQFSGLAFAIMCLLTVLLVQDVSHVAGNLLG